MRTNSSPIAIMRRSCSDSPPTASQMDRVFGSDSYPPMPSLTTTLGGTIAAVCFRCQSQRNYEFAMDRSGIYQNKGAGEVTDNDLTLSNESFGPDQAPSSPARR
jgi:hypothetical protein